MTSKRWDPTGFDTSNVEPYEITALNKFIIKYYLLIYLVLIAIAVSVSLLLTETIIETSIYLGIGLVFVFGIMYGFFGKIKKKSIKYDIAKKNDWVFKGSASKELHTLYSQRFPKIFNLGNNFRKSLEGVFWGDYEKNGEKFDFVLGNFNYSQTYHTRKGRQTKNYTDHFFILRLNTEISTNFYLKQKNIGSKFLGAFSKKNITTESIDFNKAFSFSYETREGDTEVNIMSILSPVLLEELVNFSNKKKSMKTSLGGVRVFFRRDCVVFTAPGPLLKTKGGFTPRSLEVKPSDVSEVQEELDFLFNLGLKMSSNLSDSDY